MTFRDKLAQICLITGDRDSGKTSLCKSIYFFAVKEGYDIKGIISPGIYKDGVKMGIRAENLSTRESVEFAEYRPGWDQEKPKREWKFFENALVWGNKVFASSTPTDILIIDELGFLEFEKNSGWTNAFAEIEKGEFTFAFVVVRKTLLPSALERFGTCDVFDLGVSNPSEHLAEKVFQYIRAS